MEEDFSLQNCSDIHKRKRGNNMFGQKDHQIMMQIWCLGQFKVDPREKNYLLENTKLDTSAILNHWLGQSGNKNILTAKVKVEPEAVNNWKITVSYTPCIWAMFYLIKVNPCGTMVTTAIQSLHNSIFLLRALVSYFEKEKLK